MPSFIFQSMFSMTSAEKKRMPHNKILLVASNGGHLLQLRQLADLWPAEQREWISFEKSDAISLLSEERKIWAHSPTNRNFPNLIRNFALAFRVLRHNKFQAIITTGAGVAVPFAVVGRLLA